MIRLAKFEDISRINDIYNQAVSKKFQTADSQHYKLNDRVKWFNAHDANKHPILVHVVQDTVTGWISISKYREGRKTLMNTVEVSYYVHKEYQKQGIGSDLLSQAIEKAKSLGYKTLFAMLLEPNQASIKLLLKFDFQEWGRLPKVAEIDGQEYDHLYYGLRIAP